MFRRPSGLCLRALSTASSATSTATSATPAANPSSGKGIRFWHLALGLSAPIAYYVVRDRGKTAALRDASTHLISPLRSEVEDLANRASFSRQQVERFQDELSSRKNWSSEQLSSLIGRDSATVQPWELLCLFRNSPTNGHHLGSEEIAVGLSSLAKEAELELAWRAIDPDLRPLSFESFSKLLDCMVRTGHFTGPCLLRQTRILPPEWSILSGQGVAERYYSSLNKQKDESISFEEFRTKANGLSADGDIVLWYLHRKSKSANSKT